MCHKIRVWHFPVHGYRAIYGGNLKLNAEHQSLPYFMANLERIHGRNTVHNCIKSQTKNFPSKVIKYSHITKYVLHVQWLFFIQNKSNYGSISSRDTTVPIWTIPPTLPYCNDIRQDQICHQTSQPRWQHTSFLFGSSPIENVTRTPKKVGWFPQFLQKNSWG